MNRTSSPSSLFFTAIVLALPGTLLATELHVSVGGNDAGRGTKSAPLRTIQRAAEVARPGDIITVHAGTYRERINPPRGGSSERSRIIYQAARGEQVEIKGSEVVKNWVNVQKDVWKVTLPNSFFGRFNPYSDSIHGDWFNSKGRPHHTGAVYVNGEWLVEAAKLEEVLDAGGRPPTWLTQGEPAYLLNVAWLRPGSQDAKPTRATAFAAQQGIQTAPCSEGGECIGWIEDGDWVRYENVNLSPGTERMEFRAASVTDGGIIEIRKDAPTGELLGTCSVLNTGDWQSWSTFQGRIKPVGARTLCLVFRAHKSSDATARSASTALWFAQVDGSNTTLLAQFKGINPNQQTVEINVRQTVFYPDQPGRNFITVRGFTMRHAATPWAPPTAEQIGLIGTHWSKGWLIENNVISHSVCSGIALGKYGDQWDNTSANTAEGYVKTIERALENGWNRETIGHHVVRNNTISHCEQAGIVGSLGAAFCTVTGNTIYDIHVRRLFTGAEMAGIKFHGAIDSVIAHNHIYRTCLGLWLDWMGQGTRVSGNLFHDNGRDLFLEVNHGPFVVDNNLFLSPASLLDVSEGGAFAHNLFNGKIVSAPEPNRETPYHPGHNTKVAGLSRIKGGDHRFYNNVFIGGGEPGDKPTGFGLSVYDAREYPLQTGGNVFYKRARPYMKEGGAVLADNIEPNLRLVLDGEPVLKFTVGPELQQAQTRLITGGLLGKARIPGLAYENADGSPIQIDTDYLGKKRNKQAPTPGPLERPGSGVLSIKLR